MKARAMARPQQKAPAGVVARNAAPQIVHQVTRSSGEPVEPQTRSFMESRFKHDFSGVRVHADARAAGAASAIGARAYTADRHIVFGAGEYAPRSESGRRLLAHELTHVVQQRAGAQLEAGVSTAGGPFERQADEVARAVIEGRSAAALLEAHREPAGGRPASGAVQRQVSKTAPVVTASDEPAATAAGSMCDRTKLQEFEGRFAHMYLDSGGLVTVGVGNLLPDAAAAQALPFVRRADAKANPPVVAGDATQDEIKADFDNVSKQEAKKLAGSYKKYTKLDLPDSEIDSLLDTRIAEFSTSITTAFPDVDSYPAQARAGLFDMAYNLGIGKLTAPDGFPSFCKAVKAKNWTTAAKECHRLSPVNADRNNWTKAQFETAAANAKAAESTKAADAIKPAEEVKPGK